MRELAACGTPGGRRRTSFPEAEKNLEKWTRFADSIYGTHRSDAAQGAAGKTNESRG